MKILIINAGSSSLKYQLIDMDHESIIAKGLVERIGIEGGKLTHKYGDKTYTVTPDAIKDHTEAMNLVLEALLSKEHGVISSISEIGAVGHRVLHGGEKFTASCIIDQACMDAIEENIPLGPPAQPRQPHGHPRLPGRDAGYADGGRVRHRLPSDHAAHVLPLRRAL